MPGNPIRPSDNSDSSSISSVEDYSLDLDAPYSALTARLQTTTPKIPSPANLQSGSKTLTRTAGQSYTSSRLEIGHQFSSSSAVRKSIDFDDGAAGSPCSRLLSRIIEVDHLSVQVAAERQSDSCSAEERSRSKSSDSLDELFNKCALDGGACVSGRTCAQQDKSAKGNLGDDVTSNGISSYETDTDSAKSKHGEVDDEYSELSIRFEDSTAAVDNPVQSTSLRTTANYSSLVEFETEETDRLRQTYLRTTERSSVEMTTKSGMRGPLGDDVVEFGSRKKGHLLPSSFHNERSFQRGKFGFKGFPRKSSLDTAAQNCQQCKDSKTAEKQFILREDIFNKSVKISTKDAKQLSAMRAQLSRFQRNGGGIVGGARAGYRLFPGLMVTLYIQMQLCSRTLADWLAERNEGLQSMPGNIDYCTCFCFVFGFLVGHNDYTPSRHLLAVR